MDWHEGGWSGNFFMVGCWVKVSATMVSWRRRIFKKHWLKRPKVVPKKLFRGYNVFIFVQTFQLTSSEFFLISEFLKAARCLGLAKCFTIFRFNWNFLKFNYFSAFRYFYRVYSRLLLGATIAHNLVYWVLRKILK